MYLKKLILVTTILDAESLKCYKCLNFECPDGDPGGKNDEVCQSARRFIVQSLMPFYEFGPVGYIGACPSRDERIQWTLLQQSPEECPYIRETATCSLGRLEVISEDGPRTIASYATVLGCVKSALLHYIKDHSSKGGCSIFQKSNAEDSGTFTHNLTLENCPKITDYCNGKSFCIPYSESIVKPFQHGGDKSFEAGIIIAIIFVIVIVVVIALFAAFCKNPLNRSSNYSPAQVQNISVRNIRASDPEIPTELKDDVIT